MDSISKGISQIKVTVIGETGVGKTSIINAFVSKSFSTVQPSTLGCSYVANTILLEEAGSNQYVKFEIWDTSGQERFRALAKSFYRKASVVLMVYDITRADTLEQLKRYWYHEIKENSSKDIIFALVGNKNDLYQIEQVNEATGRQYAKDIGAIFKLTSAPSQLGVESLFRHIAMQYIALEKKNKKAGLNDDNISCALSSQEGNGHRRLKGDRKAECC